MGGRRWSIALFLKLSLFLNSGFHAIASQNEHKRRQKAPWAPAFEKYFQKADFQVLAWNWFYYLFNVILSMFGIILIFVRPVSWGVSSLRTGGQSARQKGRPILFSVNNAPWQLRNTKKKYKDKQIRARKIQEKIRVSLSSYTMYTMHQREIFICISIWLILKRGQWGNQQWEETLAFHYLLY